MMRWKIQGRVTGHGWVSDLVDWKIVNNFPKLINMRGRNNLGQGDSGTAKCYRRHLLQT